MMGRRRRLVVVVLLVLLLSLFVWLIRLWGRMKVLMDGDFQAAHHPALISSGEAYAPKSLTLNDSLYLEMVDGFAAFDFYEKALEEAVAEEGPAADMAVVKFAGLAALKAQLSAAATSSLGQKVSLSRVGIPRLMHQTYITTRVLDHWREPMERCRNFHNPLTGWHHLFWTDSMGLKFVKEFYPDFLQNYLSYPFPIQRVDALRVLILYVYGGVYNDLDNGCRHPLHPLTELNDLIIPPTNFGFSNDMIASAPRHPLLAQMIRRLPAWNRNFVSPFLTVMLSTGPLFLTKQVFHFLEMDGTSDGATVSILRPHEYGNNRNAFFQFYTGSTWHLADAKLTQIILHWWETSSWAIIVAVVVGCLLLLTACAWCTLKLCRCCLRSRLARHPYIPVPNA